MAQAEFDACSVLRKIRETRFEPLGPHPRSLWAAADVDAIRTRAKQSPGLIESVRASADRLLQTNPDDPNPLQAYIGGSEALAVAQASFLSRGPADAAWIKRRLAALMALETWRAPVHGTMVYDHCMGNIAAQVALTYDLVSDAFTAAETDRLLGGLRAHSLVRFLEATGDTPVWWFRPETESNWKIMTCGDSGTAFCTFADRWPEAPEAIARAAQGVIQTLDAVPAEGDWPEGFNYWFATLQMGLRFARALRRASRGAVDLFQHPALKKTGDFAVHLMTPGPSEQGGRIYNFNDNVPQPDERSIEAVAMLAAEHRRGDWMSLARRFPGKSPLYLACDDPSIFSAAPTATAAYFPRTGVSVIRTGWSADDTVVGFKCGPSAVGHSHLDANSFILDARGQRFLLDYPYWPQAHFLGFFDTSGPRWNFDANGTAGHTSLLVDGQGQTHGETFAGVMRAPRQLPHGAILATGDASRCYPGLLKKFIRSILLLSRDRVVLRDVVECEGERQVEWLMQHAGSVRTAGPRSIVEVGGVPMSVTPLLPDRSMGWRVSDVVRESAYVNSDTLQDEVRTVRCRAFSAFRRGNAFEFLFAFHVGDSGAESTWAFDGRAGEWTLRAKESGGSTVRPDGDSLAVG